MIVDLLEPNKLTLVMYLQTRFWGRSVRMISGKAAGYNLFWIENE